MFYSVRKPPGKALRSLSTGEQRTELINQGIDTIRFTLRNSDLNHQEKPQLIALESTLQKLGYLKQATKGNGTFFKNPYLGSSVYFGLLMTFSKESKIKISFPGQAMIHKGIYKHISLVIKECRHFCDRLSNSTEKTNVSLRDLHISRDYSCNSINDIINTDSNLVPMTPMKQRRFFDDPENPKHLTGIYFLNSTSKLVIYDKNISNRFYLHKGAIGENYSKYWDSVFKRFKKVFRLEIRIKDSHLLEKYERLIFSILDSKKHQDFDSFSSVALKHFYKSHIFINESGVQDIHLYKMFSQDNKSKPLDFEIDAAPLVKKSISITEIQNKIAILLYKNNYSLNDLCLSDISEAIEYKNAIKEHSEQQLEYSKNKFLNLSRDKKRESPLPKSPPTSKIITDNDDIPVSPSVMELYKELTKE